MTAVAVQFPIPDRPGLSSRFWTRAIPITLAISIPVDAGLIWLAGWVL